MDRILIVRLGALGDIVHALPVLGALVRQWPAARVDWLVEAPHAPILALTTGLDRRIVVLGSAREETGEASVFPRGPGGCMAAVSYLRSRRYEIALDLQGLIKSAAWARLSGARRVVGFDRADLRETMAAWCYTEAVRPYGRGHVIEKNLSMAYGLGVEPGRAVFSLAPPVRPAAADAIGRAGGPRRYIILNPGAAWPNKRWPADRFGRLAASLRDRTGLRALVTWGPAERALADEVAAASDGAAQAAPPTELADLAALMRDAALVVAGDTGPLHIAAAMGTPVVGLYGPTWPERNGPWASGDEVLSRAGECECHHKRRCVRGRPCIEDIEPHEVVEAAVRRLQKAGPA